MSETITIPSKVRNLLGSIEKHKEAFKKGLAKAEVGMGRTKDLALIAAGGISAGAACAMLGGSDGHIRFRDTKIQLDGLVPALGAAAGISDAFGEFSDDAVLIFGGALAAYLSQHSFRMVKERRAASSVSGEGLYGPEIVGMHNSIPLE